MWHSGKVKYLSGNKPFDPRKPVRRTNVYNDSIFREIVFSVTVNVICMALVFVMTSFHHQVIDKNIGPSSRIIVVLKNFYYNFTSIPVFFNLFQIVPIVLPSVSFVHPLVRVNASVFQFEFQQWPILVYFTHLKYFSCFMSIIGVLLSFFLLYRKLNRTRNNQQSIQKAQGPYFRLHLLSVCPSNRPSVRLSVHLFVCLSCYPSVHI